MSHEGATEVLLFGTTSRTGQILLIPASRLALLPHVLKCPNQLSDTLVGGTTTIKMQRSIFSSTQVRPSIFRDMRQILLRIIRPRVFPTRIYHQWTQRPHAAQGIGELLWQVVVDDGTIRSLCSPGLLCSRCHDATFQSTNSLPPTQSRPTHS